MTRAGLLPLVGILMACASRPAGAAPETCAPPGAAAPTLPRADALAGTYRLRLVATSGPRQDSATDGTLALQVPEAASRPYRLIGRGELRLDEVGATAADVSSDDPMRPGALGFALPGPRLLVRLGAEANRQDVTRVEGAFTVLHVQEVSDSGFAGAWTSGAPLPVAEGYFCAWRTDEGG